MLCVYSMAEQRLQNPDANWTDYGDEDIPVGPRLSAYLLHTDEWRQAFLERLTQVGYIGLIEASERVYAFSPSRRTSVARSWPNSPMYSGSGKLAIYNSLKKFLDEFLVMPPVPPSNPAKAWTTTIARVMGLWERKLSAGSNSFVHSRAS